MVVEVASFNHLHVLSTLFEDFKRSLAAATEKLLRSTMALFIANSKTQSRAQQAQVVLQMSKLWSGFPLHAEFYVRFRAQFAELAPEHSVRMFLHWCPVNSQYFARMDASYAGRVRWPSKTFLGLEVRVVFVFLLGFLVWVFFCHC